MPEMFGSLAIPALKSTSESLAVTLWQIGVPIGIVTVVEVSPSRLDAIMPAVARNFVELAWRYVPAAFLHITRIS
jgi:hypothetical protein